MINATNFYYPTSGGITKSGKWIPWQQFYPRLTSPDSCNRAKSTEPHRFRIHTKYESSLSSAQQDFARLKFKIFTPRAVGHKLELQKTDHEKSKSSFSNSKNSSNGQCCSVLERLYTSQSIESFSDDDKEPLVNISFNNPKSLPPRYRKLTTENDGKERVLRSVFSRANGELYYEPTLDVSRDNLFRSFQRESKCSKTFINDKSFQESNLYTNESNHSLKKPISSSLKITKLKDYRYSHSIKKSPIRSTPSPFIQLKMRRIPRPKLEIGSSKAKLNIRSSRKLVGPKSISTGTNTRADNINI